MKGPQTVPYSARRRAWVLLLPALLLSAVVGVNGNRALAPAAALAGGGSCIQFYDVVDTACVDGQYGDTYHGGAMSFDSRPLYLDCGNKNLPPLVHVNDAMWLYTDNPPGTGYQSMEMGAWSGPSVWDSNCNSDPGNSQVYYFNKDTNDNTSANRFAWIPQDGSNHVVEITRDSSNPMYWDEIYDGNMEWLATGQQSSTAYEHSAGLEISANFPHNDLTWAHAGTFHNALTVENTQGIWNAWTYFNTYRNQPCGQGWSSGGCTNGSAPWDGEWDVNRG